MSAREQNRLSIQGRRIGTVVPSQKGVINYVKDEQAGALYFTLAADTLNAGSITLFISDEQSPASTCKLILTPRAIAGEEIIIKPAEEQRSSAASRKGEEGRAMAYQRHAKDLILQMADEESEDIDTIPVNQEIALWKEVRLVMVSKHPNSNMVGEKYELTNISEKNMLLVEQEMYRKGVVAVVIENQSLPPKGQTLIFIVRGRKGNE